MGEFLQSYGFCHMAHGSHGRKDADSRPRGPGSRTGRMPAHVHRDSQRRPATLRVTGATVYT